MSEVVRHDFEFNPDWQYRARGPWRCRRCGRVFRVRPSTGVCEASGPTEWRPTPLWAGLTAREREALRLRLFAAAAPASLRAVAVEMGVSPGRASQLLGAALRKLRMTESRWPDVPPAHPFWAALFGPDPGLTEADIEHWRAIRRLLPYEEP